MTASPGEAVSVAGLNWAGAVVTALDDYLRCKTYFGLGHHKYEEETRERLVSILGHLYDDEQAGL